MSRIPRFRNHPSPPRAAKSGSLRSPSRRPTVTSSAFSGRRTSSGDTSQRAVPVLPSRSIRPFVRKASHRPSSTSRRPPTKLAWDRRLSGSPPSLSNGVRVVRAAYRPPSSIRRFGAQMASTARISLSSLPLRPRIPPRSGFISSSHWNLANRFSRSLSAGRKASPHNEERRRLFCGLDPACSETWRYSCRMRIASERSRESSPAMLKSRVERSSPLRSSPRAVIRCPALGGVNSAPRAADQ